MIREGKPILSSSLKKIGELKKVFREKEEILTAYLFGSAVTKKNTKLSDVDIALLLTEMNVRDELYFEMDLREDISKIMGNDDFDLVILNKVPLVLRYQVLKSGKVLYSKDEKARIRFEEMTRDMYFDFAPIRNEYYRIFFENIEKGCMFDDRQDQG